MAPRVLIITDAFLPPMQGARMRNLARNLQREGYECRVVCERVEGSVLPDDIKISAFQYYHPHRPVTNAVLRILDKLFLLKERRYERFIRKNIPVSSFDVIIASAYLFPMRSVRRIATEAKLPLIVDLRDIVEQWDSCDYLNMPKHSRLARWAAERYIRLVTDERNLTLACCAAATTVSEWHVEQIKRYCNNTRLIYNGFDADRYFPTKRRTDTFNITYTGKLYDFSLRNPEMLFAAMEQLLGQQLINPKKTRLQFYIEPAMAQPLLQLAAQHNLQSVVSVMPFVGTEEISRILAESSISLILNNPSGEKVLHGIIPSKFYEALGAGKPVLCVPADHDCLEQIVRETGAGLSSGDTDEIKNFIIGKYAEWCSNGSVQQVVSTKHRQKFSRRYQALQFAEIIDTVCNYDHPKNIFG